MPQAMLPISEKAATEAATLGAKLGMTPEDVCGLAFVLGLKSLGHHYKKEEIPGLRLRLAALDLPQASRREPAKIAAKAALPASTSVSRPVQDLDRSALIEGLRKRKEETDGSQPSPSLSRAYGPRIKPATARSSSSRAYDGERSNEISPAAKAATNAASERKPVPSTINVGCICGTCGEPFYVSSPAELDLIRENKAKGRKPLCPACRSAPQAAIA